MCRLEQELNVMISDYNVINVGIKSKTNLKTALPSDILNQKFSPKHFMAWQIKAWCLKNISNINATYTNQRGKLESLQRETLKSAKKSNTEFK